eukprot:5815870-Prymnesium_polylepis.2
MADYVEYVKVRQLLLTPKSRRMPGWEGVFDNMTRSAMEDMQRLRSCVADGSVPTKPACLSTSPGSASGAEASQNSGRREECCARPLPLDLELLHRPALVDSVPGLGGRCYPLDGLSMRRSLTLLGHGFKAFDLKQHGRVARGESVTVVTLGSSVASGSGSDPRRKEAISPAASSHERFIAWLRYRYPPGDQIRFYLLGVAASTSEHRIASFKDVRAADPDLVLWDYSSNDYSDEAATKQGQALYRSRIEKLVRMCLQLPKHPPIMFLSLARNMQQSQQVWELQDRALEPVVRYYGQSLVSYRDAMLPTYSKEAANDVTQRCFTRPTNVNRCIFSGGCTS